MRKRDREEVTRSGGVKNPGSAVPRVLCPDQLLRLPAPQAEAIRVFALIAKRPVHYLLNLLIDLPRIEKDPHIFHRLEVFISNAHIAMCGLHS